MGIKQVIAPGDEIRIFDLTGAVEEENEYNYDGPVYCIACATPKGTEKLTRVKAATNKKDDNFTIPFGRPNFKKYGQSSIMAGILAQDGAEIIFKRLVAEDSLLANLSLFLKIIIEEKQLTNDEGFNLYIDSITGLQTTVAEGNTPLTTKIIKLMPTCKSYPNMKSIDEIVPVVRASYNETEMIFPIWTITDIGRGVSAKKIRISPDYHASKRLSAVRYNLEIIENSARIEYMNFYLNPSIISNNMSQDIETVVSNKSQQINAKFYEDYYDLFVAKLAELLGISDEDDIANLECQDLLFCKTKNGSANIENYEVYSTDEDYSNISSAFGLALDNGSNGAFGDSPLTAPEYKEQLLAFYNGDLTDDIYDIDNYKIDIFPDAGFDLDVKLAILELCEYRMSFAFLDMGTEYNTYRDILETAMIWNEEGLNSYFGELNHLWYKILDPYSKRHITVTNTLELCELAINHFENGRKNPFAGQLYSMKYKRIIPGTQNYIPINTRDEDKRQAFIDARINYAVLYKDVLYQETQVTLQTNVSEACNINNIFNVLQVVNKIREVCPQERYSYIDGEDLTDYNQTINDRVISKYKSGFKTLNLVYLQDEEAKANKQYYAAINASFYDFEQNEIYDIYITNDEDAVVSTTTTDVSTK